MLRYVIRRLIALVPILVGVSILVFVMMRLVPGDPARMTLGPEATGEQVALLRHQWGLDRPLPVQYLFWLQRAVHGDFGRSTVSRVPASQEIITRFPATLKLTAASMAVSIVLGLVFGVVAAVRHNTLFDRASMVVALLGVCTPSFWLGLMLLLLFAVKLPWLPSFGQGGISHLILPALTLGAGSSAIIARVTRSSMLEVLGEDYVRTARAKGLEERLVIVRHALKNALIPIITILGLEFGGLLAGAVVTETVFSYPGLGLLLINSINNRDFPIVQGALLLFALEFVLVNLLVDVIYARVDPRITYS
ncbi:MAG TPA: nickel ABC transporter permease [Thermomicrobiales bacterium]|nr:nickel ABC transporter permease [Thermomicrobiales bacterium]